MRNTITVFYAKKGSQFDEGSELDLLEDYRKDGAQSGMFMGLRDGKLIELMCDFSEVRITHQSENVK